MLAAGAAPLVSCGSPLEVSWAESSAAVAATFSSEEPLPPDDPLVAEVDAVMAESFSFVTFFSALVRVILMATYFAGMTLRREVEQKSPVRRDELTTRLIWRSNEVYHGLAKATPIWPDY
jgi:hypothetical protein